MEEFKLIDKTRLNDMMSHTINLLQEAITKDIIALDLDPKEQFKNSYEVALGCLKVYVALLGFRVIAPHLKTVNDKMTVDVTEVIEDLSRHQEMLNGFISTAIRDALYETGKAGKVKLRRSEHMDGDCEECSQRPLCEISEEIPIEFPELNLDHEVGHS
jgi:hypothetical protein